MKTNRFEENLRKKLEGIQPEYKEADWESFTSFRGTAGSGAGLFTVQKWMAYAASVLLAVAAVAGGLSVVQYQQNKKLQQEVAALKKSVEGSLGEKDAVSSPEVESRTDTVYIYKEVPVYYERQANADGKLAADEELDVREDGLPAANQKRLVKDEPESRIGNSDGTPGLTENNPSPQYAGIKSVNEPSMTVKPESGITVQSVLGGFDLDPIETEMSEAASPLALRKGRYVTILPHLKEQRIAASHAYAGSEAVQKWNRVALKKTGKNKSSNTSSGVRELAANFRGENGNGAKSPEANEQLSSRYGDNPELSKSNSGGDGIKSVSSETKGIKSETGLANTATPGSTESVKDTKKEEKTVPTFISRFPYRVGVGQSFDRLGRATSLQMEAVVSKRFYFGLGVSSRTMKSIDFMNDLDFKHRTGQDFVKQYGAPFMNQNQFPGGFEKYRVSNITTRVEGVDIPIRLGYRAELGRNFAWLAGLGTSIKANERRRIVYDVRYQNGAELQLTVLETCKNRLLDNFTVSTGIEKSFGPLVLQGEAYLSKSSKPVPFNPSSSTLGGRVRIMYQFGARN